METIFSVVQIASAVLLSVLVLLQPASGGGLEGAIGGGSGGQVIKHKRRGFEKFAFNATIALVIILIVSILLPRFLTF